MDYKVHRIITLADCPDNDRTVGPIRDGRAARNRERLRGPTSLARVPHGRTSESWCGPRNDRKRHLVAVCHPTEPYRLTTRGNQSPPLHYCIQQRRLANIRSPCRGLASLSDGVLGQSGVDFARRTCYNNLANNVTSSKRVVYWAVFATSGSRMEGGMDDTEPAAATNSAVFEENRSGMRCEVNVRSPIVRSTFGAFEAQAMSE